MEMKHHTEMNVSNFLLLGGSKFKHVGLSIVYWVKLVQNYIIDGGIEDGA